MKTNIKIRVNPEQSKRVQEICFENGFYWNDERKEIMNIDYSYLYIRSNLKFGDYEDKFKSCDLEEIDADLFIRTNGSCEERLIDNDIFVLCDSQWQNDGESGLYYENVLLKKKIENLHIALNKKVEKNKNQAMEIGLLLKQKEEYKKNVHEGMTIIHQFGNDITKLEEENRKLKVNKDKFNIINEANDTMLDKMKELYELLDEKDTIIKYLEGKLNEK